MSRSLLKIWICLIAVGWTLFEVVDRQNEVTELRIKIPKFKKELRELKEENIRLRFEIETFASPQNLLKISQNPEYGHLHYE